MLIIGVTTYNRLEVLQRMAASLHATDLSEDYEVRVYDDASTDYDEETLKALLPEAAIIHRQVENLGSDANILYMYEDFLHSGAAWFFNADSDLIFARDWLSKGRSLLPQTDGILSLFHTLAHPDLCAQSELVEKESLGSAGTFFSRERLAEFVASLKGKKLKSSVDWTWSHYFRTHGVRLMATQRSYVQHIGIEGFNSSQGKFDFGEGFAVSSSLNGQILNDTLLSCARKTYGRKSSGGAAYAVFPFQLVPHGARIVLYGAGKAGRDYKRQLLVTGYAELAGVVDKNYQDHAGVLPPQALCQMAYDYIVIAVLQQHVAETIRQDILAVNPALVGKIVYAADSVTHI